MAEHNPVRWTIESASREFGVSRPVLSARITQSGTASGADKKYSTADICRAVFGDIESEKLRLVREQADAQAIKNQVARRELLPMLAVRRHLESVIIAVRSGIVSSALIKEEKEDLINNLKKLGETVRVDDDNEPED